MCIVNIMFHRVSVINHMAKGAGPVMWCVTLVPVPDDACRDSSVATRLPSRATIYPHLDTDTTRTASWTLPYLQNRRGGLEIFSFAEGKSKYLL